MNPNLFEGCDSMVGFPAAAACPCKSGPDLFLLGLKMQRKARMMLVTVDCSGYSRPRNFDLWQFQRAKGVAAGLQGARCCMRANKLLFQVLLS